MSSYLLTYIIMMVVYRLLEITVMRGSKRRLSGNKSDSTYYFMVIPFMLAITEPPLEHILTGHQPGSGYFLGGIALFAVATLFRIKGLMDIKGGFSPVIEKQENHELVTAGLYSVVRHPLYLSMLLLIIAAAIMLAAVWAWVFILLTFVGIIIRIREEEKFLLAELPGYQAYRQKTWCLIPGIF